MKNVEKGDTLAVVRGKVWTLSSVLDKPWYPKVTTDVECTRAGEKTFTLKGTTSFQGKDYLQKDFMKPVHTDFRGVYAIVVPSTSKYVQEANNTINEMIEESRVKIRGKLEDYIDLLDQEG